MSQAGPSLRWGSRDMHKQGRLLIREDGHLGYICKEERGFSPTYTQTHAHTHTCAHTKRSDVPHQRPICPPACQPLFQYPRLRSFSLSISFSMHLIVHAAEKEALKPRGNFNSVLLLSRLETTCRLPDASRPAWRLWAAHGGLHPHGFNRAGPLHCLCWKSTGLLCLTP